MAVVEEINDEDIRPTSSNDVNPTESGFLGSLANSIFEPGVNKSLFQGPVLSPFILPHPDLTSPQLAMNFSFFALILTLLGMAFLTSWNRHVLFLMAVSAGLWGTMIWFVAEISRVQTQPQNGPPPMDGPIPDAQTPDLPSQGTSSATQSGQARQRRS